LTIALTRTGIFYIDILSDAQFHLTAQVKMNVNKKLDRFKQWAGERMGGEVKTNVSDDFKALEVEMALRHEGMCFKSSQLSNASPARPLTVCRHGAAAKVHDHLCQDVVEAKRRRR